MAARPTGERADRVSGEEPSSRYEVLAKIASGGMATVYVGRARGAAGFSRLVAIKRPHPFVSEDPALRGALEREARVASMIHHPHVVSVLDVELRGDEVTLILDYVEGCSLWELLHDAVQTRNPLPARAAIRVVLDVAGGLHAAHVLRDGSGAPLGIVHRDVSPQNVLVGVDGHARLTDFGIAKVASDLEHTSSNVIKGKLAYLPPEYVGARTFDTRSDQYALAVVAWEAITGRRLFRGTELEVLQQIMQAGALPPSQVRPDLAPLDDVLGRALARDPARRFESVSAFAGALEERARRLGWVAPHEEVAARVDTAAGELLRNRRGEIELSAVSRSEPVSGGRRIAASPRDAMPTLSLSARVEGAPATPAASSSGGVAGSAEPRRRAVAISVAAACAVAGVLAAIALVELRSPRDESSVVAPVSAAAAAPAEVSATTTPAAAPAACASRAVLSPPEVASAAVADETTEDAGPPPRLRPARPRHRSSGPRSPIRFQNPG